MKTTTRGRGAALWTVQVLLGLLFVWAGVLKFILPVEILTSGPAPLPLAFLRFIGAAELLGGLGLILPGLLRVARGLTPLAALGLLTIMAGATVVSVAGGAIGGAVVPAVLGLLAALIVLGRSDWSSVLPARA